LKTLINNNKYLSTDLIEECFENGKVHFVDKILTGNGFSHGFSLLKPKIGKVNILIAPNQSVVKDKQKEFETGNFGFPGCKAAFVYEGNGLKGHAKNFDLIVIVSDSFVNFSWKIEGITDKIMVDEYHSTMIQSSFRYKLKQMFSVLNDKFKDVALSFVTASPTLLSKTTIKIINKYIDEKELKITNNQKNSIQRCVDSIHSGKTTFIFCQDATIIKTLLQKAKLNEFNLIAGTSFTTTILTKSKYKLNENSNVLIGSSASFEGWSSQAINGNVFMFMNIANKHTTFLGCNIYQSIGRLRKGFNYAEVCVTNLNGGGFKNNSINNLVGKVEKFISIPEAVEKKQSKKYEFYYKGEKVKSIELMEFIYFKRNESKYIIERFEPAFLIHNEIQKIDEKLNVYKDFFEERKIKMIYIDSDITKKRLTSRTKTEVRIENIIHNITVNKKEDLFFDFFFKVKPKENFLDYYLKELTILLTVAKGINKDLDDKYFKLLEFYNNGGYNNELKDLFVEAKKEKGEGREKIRQKLSDFDDNEFIWCLEVAFGIVFERFDPYYVGHRNYNKLTSINLKLIYFIAEKLGVNCVEIDIKNAFPRIVYALNGLTLPNTFYDVEGVERSKQKFIVNMTLNSFRYKQNNNRPKSQIKAESINRLKKCNFNEQTIQWLIDNFFEAEYKGDFFNYIAYHEKRIIKELTELILSYNLSKEYSIFRRHDSVLIFTNDNLNFKNLFELKYLEITGWIDQIKEDKIDDIDDLFLREIEW